jgi:RHS repeat-associated protein
MGKLLPKLFVALTGILATGSVTPVVAQTSWSNGYAFRRTVTVDHTKVPNTDQTNFPVLVSGAYSDMATVANGGNVTSANGFDIIFTSDAAGSNPLAFEQESYNPSTGAITYWVKIPTVSYTTDTTIYLFYGNSSVVTDQSNKTAVWDANYVGVWHLPNGTSLSAADSTGNGNNGTVTGVTAVSGQIDGGGNFNGSSKITIQPPGSLSGSFTIEAWAKPSSLGGLGLFGSRSPSDMGFDAYFTGSGLHGDIGTGTSWLTTSANANFSYAANTWHHVVYAVTPTGYNIYIDGSQFGAGSFTGTPLLFDSNHTLFIGSIASNSTYFNGVLDEVHLSNVTRSADWIAAEYKNQSNSAAFGVVGTAAASQDSVFISNLSPALASIGDTVTIRGGNFGASQGNSTVLFNGVTVSPQSWSDTTIAVIVSGGAFSGPFTVTVNGTTVVSPALTIKVIPSGWSDGDIGSVGNAGNASYTNGTFTVSGAGSQISGSADSFHFVYQPMSGDGTIVARVLSISSGGNRLAGVMIRETLNTGSTNAKVADWVGYGTFAFEVRGTTWGNTSQPGSTAGTFPYWLKVTRSGSTFSGYVSADGMNWTQLGTSQTISMAQTVYVGLAVTSGSTTATTTATFDNVSVSSSSSPGPVITSVSATTGSVGSQVVIYGSGFGEPQGNSVVTLNGTSTTVNSWSATSITVTIPVGATTGPLVVSVAPSMNASNPVAFTVTSQPLPMPWLDRDIGSVGLVGSTSYTNGTFTISGAGSQVSGSADSFHFVYQPLSGDGTIVARVLSISSGAGNRLAGVMIRETLNTSSTNAKVANLANYNGFYFELRGTTGGGTSQPGSIQASCPYWVKVARSGSTFSGYVSADGMNWTQLGTSQTINMAQTVYVGLAVTSGSTTATTTATFDNVSVSSSSSPGPVITSVSATTGSVGSQVVIYGSGFGEPQGNSVVTLNGTSTTVNSWSATSITVTIPVGATTGPLVVSVAPSMNASNPVAFTVTSQPLPMPWLDRDIGTVGVAGSASYANSVFTLKGAGTSLASTSDGFHFVYQQISGDGSVVARVLNIASGQTAGVELRETLDPSSKSAFVAYYNSYIYINYRASTGGSTSQAYLSAGTLPYWVKVTRSGNSITGYASADGVNWSQVGTTLTISMAQTVYVGLGVSSGNTSTLATGTLDNVSVTSTANPAPFISSVSATTGSVGSQVIINGSNFGTPQGNSQVLLNGLATTINAWSATSITITIPVGATSGPLAVSVAPSMNNSNPVQFEVTTQPLPQGLLNRDVGQVAVAGTATYLTGLFDVVSSGSISGSADSFHFVYQPLSGDGSIVARVAYLAGVGNPQIGVMIRETLDRGAANAFLFYQPNQAFMYYRPSTGSSTSQQTVSLSGLLNGSYPYWVKLTRSGNSFSGYVSMDGVYWAQIGTSLSITMAQNVYVGLATSANNGSTREAKFDNVSISSTASPAPAITNTSATTGAIGNQITINGTGFGAGQGSSAVYLNDAPMTINSWSDSSITATIPSGATTGYLGVAVGAALNGTDPVWFSVTSQPLPSGWLDRDMGRPGMIYPTGSATYSNGTVTINTAGYGIDSPSTSDSMHLVYQTLSGDGSIVARVSNKTTNYAGLLIRETLDPSSKGVMVNYSPTQAYLYTRSTNGAAITLQPTGFSFPAYPYWVRMTRSGNSFSGYASSDGVYWTQVGTTQTIQMAQTVYVALAGAWSSNGSLQLAAFDNVSFATGAILPAPVVTTALPTVVGPGYSVTITGSNFGDTQGTSQAYFNGVAAASITSWSSTQIVASVPTSATTGPVSVVVAGVGSNRTVSVTVYNPTITSLTPPAASTGGSITIAGSGFGANPGNSVVKFNGVSASASSWSDTSITAVVPSSATSGPVTVTEGGVVSNYVQFTVLEPLAVTGISPTIGAAGTTVTINGAGFGPTQSNSTVDFYGTVATVTSWSDTQITALVPVGAPSGSVDVNVAGNMAYGPSFTVTSSLTLTDSLGNTTSYTVALIGGMWRPLNSQGSGCSSCSLRGTIQNTYDAAGNVLTRTDELGHTTTYTYDTSNNVLSVSVPTGSGSNATTSYTYNSLGAVLTSTDPLGNVTTNTYDTKGNLLTVTTPAPGTGASASVTHFAYDTKGQLTSITDPLNNVTALTYTPAGLISTITDAQNKVTTYGYDAHGNRTSVTDALNHQTTFAYDAGDRLTTITYPGSTTTTFGYDYRGRRTSVTDQNGKTTTYAYDDADRLTSVTDAANNVTTYTYDTEDNLTTIKDANNHSTTFAYDTFGRVTQTTFPSGAVETYSYDAVGNLTGKIDRKNQSITYAYDTMNRLAQKTYPDLSTVNYTYDNDSRLTQVSDPTGTYSFTFDNMGRLTGTTTGYSFLTSRTFTTSYAYDAGSNRTGFTDPESGSTTYAYDTLNRLQTLTPPVAISAGSFGFSYDGLSRRTQMTRPNSVATNYAYDNLSRLASVLHQLSGSTIDGATYTVDNAGNRTAKTDQRTAVATNYGYDAIYQLLSATPSGGTAESYTYDPVGNRLSSAGVPSYSYNTSNELTSTSTATYGYDNNGNAITKNDSTGITTYAWDYENRLTSVTLPGSGGTVSFAYDPFGRRVKKVSTTGTSIFAYDGDNLIEETNASGAVVARYSQGLNIDEPLAMLRSSTTSYYQADGLGSVTSLSNGAGSLAQTYSFDSFGKTTATGSLVNPFQYTGRESDSETGLYYYRARYYDRTIGRFLSEDPMRFVGDGVDFYLYVANQPVRNTDPRGLNRRLGGLIGGKCCNTTTQDEWWLDDGVWKRLPPGKCTRLFDDCDGMTCGGGFYSIGDLEHGTCKSKDRSCEKDSDRRWTPNLWGPHAVPPGLPYPGYHGSRPGRGGPIGNPPPPGYKWGSQ